MKSVKAKIRDITDFPAVGICFKDITPLLQDADVLKSAVTALVAPYHNASLTAVAGMEARGFIFGALAAQALQVGFIPLRKPGKLPHQTHQVEYALEYGNAALEIHRDAIHPGDRILIVDDVLATGGTAQASCQLVEALGGLVVGCAFLLEISALNGRDKLDTYSLHTVIDDR